MYHTILYYTTGKKGNRKLNKKLTATLLARIDEVGIRESLLKKENIAYLKAEYNNSEYIAKIKTDLFVNNCISDISFSSLITSLPMDVLADFYKELFYYLTQLDLTFDVSLLNANYQHLVLVKTKLISYIIKNKHIVNHLLSQHIFVLEELLRIVARKNVFPIELTENKKLDFATTFVSLDITT